jgi:hypothetical protein
MLQKLALHQRYEGAFGSARTALALAHLYAEEIG